MSADHPRGLPSGQHRVPGSLLSNNIGDVVFVCMVMILFQIVIQGSYIFCFIAFFRQGTDKKKTFIFPLLNLYPQFGKKKLNVEYNS